MLPQSPVQSGHGIDQGAVHRNPTSSLRSSDGSLTLNGVESVEEHGDPEEIKVMEKNAGDASRKGETEALNIAVEARVEHKQPAARRTVRFPGTQ